MTQITVEQQQELKAIAERAVTKLQTFAESLPDDERSVLAALLGQTEAGGRRSNDTAGFFFNPYPAMRAAAAQRGASGALDAVNSVDWQKVYDALGGNINWGAKF